MDAPVVSLIDVHAVYEGERHATLHDITLHVQRGEQVAITGPNGSGKTTILEVIDGLLPITSGSVHVLGEPVSQTSHRLRSRIAYVPQNLFFDPDTPFLVRDVVLAARFGRMGHRRLPRSQDRKCVNDALAAIGMNASSGHPIGRLSGGQQRKVLIARALAQEADLLLLDEPTANLDPRSKEEVADLVATVRSRLDATSIVVSHEAGALLAASSRAIAIDAGRIVEEQDAVLTTKNRRG